MELPELELLLGNDQPSYRARQLYEAIYRQRSANVAEVKSLPAALRQHIENLAPTGALRAESTYRSTDGTCR